MKCEAFQATDRELKDAHGIVMKNALKLAFGKADPQAMEALSMLQYAKELQKQGHSLNECQKCGVKA